MTSLHELSPWMGKEPAVRNDVPKFDEKTALAFCLAMLSLNDLFGVSVDCSNVSLALGRKTKNTFLCDTLFFGTKFPLITVDCKSPIISFKDEPWWFSDGISHGNLQTVGDNKTFWLWICYNWAKDENDNAKNLVDDSTWDTIRRLHREPALLEKFSFRSFFALETQPTLRDFVKRLLQNFPAAAGFDVAPPTPVTFKSLSEVQTQSCVLMQKKCDNYEYDKSLAASIDDSLAKIDPDPCLFRAYKYPASVFKEGGYSKNSTTVVDNAAAFYFLALNDKNFFKGETLGNVLSKFWNVRRCNISWGRVCCWNYNCAKEKMRLYTPDMCQCEPFDINLAYPSTWSLGQIYWLQNRDKEGLFAMIRKIVFGFKGKSNDKKIEECLSKGNDMEIYECLHQLFVKNRKPEGGEFDRGAFRVAEIEGLGVFEKLPPNPQILDFGANQGEIATALARRFDIDKSSCFAIDVENWFGTKKIVGENPLVTFVLTRTNLLPFANAKFDFITCLQVLHHLDDPMLTLSELYRVLAPDGILLVREHEADSDKTRALIDVEHSLFEMVQKEPEFDYLQNYRADYFSRGELQNIMKSSGFQLIHLTYPEPSGPTRYYYSAWKKI